MMLKEKDMKNRKRLFVLAFSVVIWCILSSIPANYAYAEGIAGGAVQTNGEITLYDETSPSTTDSSLPPGSTNDSIPEPKPKPKGKLPSTGELVKTSLFVSGIALVMMLFFFYLWKQKKSKQTGGE